MIVDFKYDFNDEVKVKGLNLKGVIKSADYWNTGCKRYGIQPPMTSKSTEPPKLYWADEIDIELIKSAKKARKKKPTGGPHQNKTTLGLK